MSKEIKTLDIQYRFCFPDGGSLDFTLSLNPRSLEQVESNPKNVPAWTSLGFHQCPNCPLNAKTHPHCPVAVNLVKLTEECGGLWSYDKVHLEVTTPERVVSKDTTMQAGVSSLLGLVMATSACPHAEFFKPMARFHLPFASEDETIYRATSMYLLAQYFLHKQGGEADLELDGLVKIYRNLQIINSALAARLRAASERDAAVNAVILLDLFAKVMPYTINDSLDEIRHLFAPFLADAGGTMNQNT